MTYRALLLGNSVFDADASLQPLNAPVKDVARLHRALVDAEVGMFDDEQVRLVIERSSNDILDELDQFFDAGRRDDLLLLYYSGHGVLDERNHLYLCGRDTRTDRLLRTAISNTRINEFIHQSACQQTVILLDCCASGMFKGGQVGAQLAGPGRYIVSSTRGMALANDAATTTGTSLFTDYFVEGMLGVAADRDGDGYLDLRDVYDHVRHRLTSTSKQVPQCRFDGDGAVPMARVGVPIGVSGARARRGQTHDPSFELSETQISLLHVDAGEDLPVEFLEVYPLTDEPLDLEARGSAAWIHVDVSSTQLSIRLDPGPGRNRGKIVARDRNSGTTQVVRVEVFVHAAAGSPDAVPATKAPTTSTSTEDAPSEAQSPGAATPRTSPPGTEPASRPAYRNTGQTGVSIRKPLLTRRGIGGRRRHLRRYLVLVACLVVAAGAVVLILRSLTAGPCGLAAAGASSSEITIPPCHGGYHKVLTTSTDDPVYSKPAATGSPKYFTSQGYAYLVCRKYGMRFHDHDIWYLTKHGGWLNDSYLAVSDGRPRVSECRA
jgi:Caspase domain